MFAIEVGEPDGAASLTLMDAKSKKLLIAEAARWYARVHAPDCSDAERSACLAWRQLSTGHDQAFLQTEQVATRVTEGLLTDPRLRAMAATALGNSALGKSLDLPVEAERANVSCWRVAAALVVSVGLGLLATVQLTKHHAGDSIASYNNTTNGQQQIALADGSIVHLDVGSRLTAKMDAAGRHVELLAGRAYFEVVHDSARPFSVVAVWDNLHDKLLSTYGGLVDRLMYGLPVETAPHNVVAGMVKRLHAGTVMHDRELA